MPILITREAVLGDIHFEISRLEALVSDLRRLAEGRRPQSDVLEAAPLLERWTVDRRPDSCLRGVVHGHPTLWGPEIVTSAVWVLAPELGWARTLSRHYRLGRSAQGEHAH
ncbi:DUF6634 family protein [Lichenicoccus roseus]|uniref:DUF6634 family protein n=1 Tax=Lichenicoccus roseus TaxID=2683649 RepID=UPI0038D17C96